MSVIPLTIIFSLLLAGTFIVLFAFEQHRGHLTSPERDSLLPLADEASRLSGRQDAGDRDDGGCSCRAGSRPCAACLRRRAAADQDHRYF
jgi:hypothetical protein